MTTALYQNQHIRQLESYVLEQKIDTEIGLMTKAGVAALAFLQRHWPQARKITICCGKGNNGGDGYVVAQLAHAAGLVVTVIAMCAVHELSGAAALAAQAAIQEQVPIHLYDEPHPLHADLIVDALLGTGLSGDVSERYAGVIAMINAAECPVLALDIPSGLDANTGHIWGSAVQAEATMAFIGLKQGLYTNKGPSYCGEVFCDQLNIPDKLVREQKYTAALLQWDEIKKTIPRRHRDAHKGDYGHVLVVGGDYGMGAVRMAAEAAMRVGAGLVSVATRPEHVSVVNCSRPEIMCHQVTQAEDLDPLIARATVLVIGPGLGTSDWGQELLNRLLTSSLPKIIDADALNLLSQVPRHADDWILTPHPGEASRLLNTTTPAIQEDRFKAAAAIQQRYGGVVILKGVGSIVKSAHGIAMVCPAGNPGMATGGMGDILSGVIGGLVAQKLSLQQAAESGVLVHALAADRAAELGGERGLLATDLMQYLRKMVNPGE